VVGQCVVLAPSQSFKIEHIAHVVYTPSDDPILVRETTLVHVGITPNTGTKNDILSLEAMGFKKKIKNKWPLYTIH
jgi:hypothetical protein